MKVSVSYHFVGAEHAGALSWGHRPDVSMHVLSSVIMTPRKRSIETQQGRTATEDDVVSPWSIIRCLKSTRILQGIPVHVEDSPVTAVEAEYFYSIVIKSRGYFVKTSAFPGFTHTTYSSANTPQLVLKSKICAQGTIMTFSSRI